MRHYRTITGNEILMAQSRQAAAVFVLIQIDPHSCLSANLKITAIAEAIEDSFCQSSDELADELRTSFRSIVEISDLEAGKRFLDHISSIGASTNAFGVCATLYNCRRLLSSAPVLANIENFCSD